MKAIVLAAHRLSGLGGWIAVCAMVAALLLVLSEIFGRTLFNRTLYVTEEYSGYLMCVLTFSSLAYTLREKGHIRMVFLLRALSRAGRLQLNLACHTVGFLFGIGFTAYCFGFFWDSLVSGSQSMQVSETYLAIPQFFMPLGALLLSFQFLGEILRDLLVLRGGAEAEPGVEEEDLGR
ncbi:MAG: TRAP transporter small permease [Desulfobacterales bacterium]